MELGLAERYDYAAPPDLVAAKIAVIAIYFNRG
jgi:hypothetical protein